MVPPANGMLGGPQNTVEMMCPASIVENRTIVPEKDSSSHIALLRIFLSDDCIFETAVSKSSTWSV